jgi:hypothetical protein
MLNSEPEAGRRALSSRLPGIVLGLLLMATAAGLAIGSRAAPFYLGAMLLASLALGDRERIARLFQPSRTSLLVPLALLIGYAAISASWAREPLAALEKAAIAVAVVLATTVCIAAVDIEDRVARLHIAEGLWLGFAVALAYSIFESLSGQAGVRAVVNALGLGPGWMKPPDFYTFRDGRLIAIDRNAMSRNIAPLTLLLWPALMAVRSYVRPRPAAGIMALLLVATAVAVMISPHETSKLALVIGLAAWLFTRYLPRAALPTMRASWVAACVLVIPMAIALHEAGLHKQKWLQFSARHRIEIWNHSARDTLASPIFGNGAMSTYATIESVPPDRRSYLTPPHQHNVFLQVWNELGVVGALLLLALGWRFLGVIAGLAPRLQPYACAFMASAAAVAASSYGIWQIWFLALYGIAALAFMVGVTAHRDRPQ